MGTLLVLIGGLIGAGCGHKKSFMANWIFLINLTFALYVSIFLASLAVPLLDIPGLVTGYKNAIAVGGVFFIVNIILQKIVEQIIPNPENDYNLPPISRLFGAGAGFLSGVIVVGILLYCFIQTPFARGFSREKDLRSTARNTLMGVVHTVNAFSFQSLTPEAVKEMQSLYLLPKKKTPAPGKAGQQKPEDSKNQTDPKNQSADGSVKRNPAGTPARADGKPEKTKKTAGTSPARS